MDRGTKHSDSPPKRSDSLNGIGAKRNHKENEIAITNDKKTGPGIGPGPALHFQIFTASHPMSC